MGANVGWGTFRIGTWTYYILINIRGVQLVAFHKGKRIVGKLTKKPKIKAPKKGKKPKKGSKKPKKGGKKPKHGKKPKKGGKTKERWKETKTWKETKERWQETKER